MTAQAARLKRWVIGAPKNPLDPHVFHQVSLVAFLAWVGLVADGLSSACYGPEEAFLALGADRFLAPYLVLATALTVLIISVSYSQIIELFPTGGGGYLVASKLLGARAGLVSGCALVVDYVLTIAISIASGADAIFSFLPIHMQHYKLAAAIAGTVMLILLNLRGVRESVTFLVPIFLCFLATHAIVIIVALFSHATTVPTLLANTATQTGEGVRAQGFFVLLGIFLHSYSMGAGTYTGIEAVSNGLPILREPRAATGKRTMLYMATSLAFTAGGILVGYMLLDVHPQPGRTLNAVLIDQLMGQWTVGSIPFGQAFLFVALLSAGALLFVAAQTGFLDGPRVLASMAVDSWVPHRFYQLSDRLVTQNGTLMMGAAALAVLLYSGGRVGLLIVLYSINVFLTFSLSQLGMCVHWWQVRGRESNWKHGLVINGIGLLLTTGILMVTVSLKFSEGGWVTVLITSALVVLCWWIRGHYDYASGSLHRLDNILQAIPAVESPQDPSPLDPAAPTAIMLVTGYNGLGMHSFLQVPQLFGSQFRQFVFVSMGVIDSSRFKGVEELANLEAATVETLKRYTAFAQSQGFAADYRYCLGTDTIEDLTSMCTGLGGEFPRAVVFTGKLVFQQETALTRILHNQAAQTLQRRLQFAGVQSIVLPIRVM